MCVGFDQPGQDRMVRQVDVGFTLSRFQNIDRGKRGTRVEN